MSEANTNHAKEKNPCYDNMSTEELRDLLRNDILFLKAEESDIDAVMKIVEVIAEREKDLSEDDFVPMEEARDAFFREYLPTATAVSLYDESDAGQEQSAASNRDEIQKQETPDRPLRQWRKVMRFAVSVSAAVLVLICSNALITNAYGVNLWKLFTSWTDTAFSFSTTPSESGSQIDPSIRELFEEYEMEDMLYPTYIPEGYTLVGIDSLKDPYRAISIEYTNDDDSIVLSFFYSSESSTSFQKYYKDYGSPELYKCNGVEFYIMRNIDKYNVVWMCGEFECGISGIITKEELFDMIDSLEVINES